jgi:acyl-CoA synthetase (AMP-forming)/AMP-acid ligase II
MELLHTTLDQQATRHPDQPFLHFEGTTVTFAQVRQRSQQLARALVASGIRPRDRVAFLLRNRPELVYCYFACLRLGVVGVPLNTRYQRPEARYALAHSEARALIVGADFFSMVGPLCRKGELHEHTVVVDGAAAGVDHWPDYEAFVAAAPEQMDWPTIPADTPAVLLYTSGSTANPKGVIHSQASLRAIAQSTQDTTDDGSLRASLVWLSACHVAALTGQVLRNVISGKPLVLLPDKDPARFFESLGTYQCTDTALLPTDLVELLEQAGTDSSQWRSLRFCLCGGDKVPEDVQAQFLNLTGLEVTEGYGMTECGLVLCNPPYERKALGSMGIPVQGVQLSLRGADGKEVALGESGNLWVRGPGLFVEYWNNPNATAEVRVDGWLNTGDRARRTADGAYRFEGRSKLIIVRGGSNISPQEVEEVIDHHPAVEECCVVGVPDRKWGEILQVFVLLHSNSQSRPSEQEIREYAGLHLASYKVPERVVFLEAMPYNATGKLHRVALRERAIQEAR